MTRRGKLVLKTMKNLIQLDQPQKCFHYHQRPQKYVDFVEVEMKMDFDGLRSYRIVACHCYFHTDLRDSKVADVVAEGSAGSGMQPALLNQKLLNSVAYQRLVLVLSIFYRIGRHP